MPTDAADRLGSKLDAFTASLDGEEREIFTTMLAFALVGTEAFADEPEVEGFMAPRAPSLGGLAGLPSGLQMSMESKNALGTMLANVMRSSSEAQSGVAQALKPS